MTYGIHIFSEVGKLNKVLLHRLGGEVEGLIPDNIERLLFDDIPYVEIAQKEHDIFAGILRDNGVEVVYYTEETAKALSNESVREKFITEFLDSRETLSDNLREELNHYFLKLPPAELVKKAINGILREEINIEKHSLSDYINDGNPYYLDPLPNLYFTRDPGACVGNGLSINYMKTNARRKESLLLKYMYMYNRDFASADNPLWYDCSDPHAIEGGDIHVLSKDIIAVGLSQRTTAIGIEHFAEKILKTSDFKKILVFRIPSSRAFMHLDTVFTMVDYDKFTIHPEIEELLQIFEVTLDAKGKSRIRTFENDINRILCRELKLPAVKMIRCGGEDIIAVRREQWNDASNSLCIAPGKVITYDRNYVTNEILDKEGIEVIAIPSSELSRGRGGTRCMSCPINRDDI